MAPRHVVGEQHRAVRIADFRRVRDRQQRVRQHLVREIDERLRRADDALPVLAPDRFGQLVDPLAKHFVLRHGHSGARREVVAFIVPRSARHAVGHGGQPSDDPLRFGERRAVGHELARGRRDCQANVYRQRLLFFADAPHRSLAPAA